MKKHYVALFILGFIMLALPLHLRFAHNNPTLPGTEGYYHARITHSLPTIQTDQAIINERPLIPNPYHYVLYPFYLLLGPLVFTLLPLLFALLSIYFLKKTLDTFTIKTETKLWILFAYAISPPLIATAFFNTPHAFVLALITFGTWALQTRTWPLATIALTTATFSGTPYAIATIGTLLFFFFNKKTLPVITTLIITSMTFLLSKHPSIITITPSISQYISDFGGVYGYSIFATLLALIGAILIWNYKTTYYSSFVLFTALIITSYFIPHLLPYTNIIISALAGIALSALAKRKWRITYLRNITLLILFCGILFSGISHAVTLADTQPTPALFDALNIPPGTVLAPEQYGFWIQAAGHRTLLDPLWQHTPHANEQYQDAYALFMTTEPQTAQHLIDKYDITYILITPEMENGLVWEREEQGLSFLVENSETFKRLETGTSIRVWKTP